MMEESPWRCFRQDLTRYGGWGALIREQSLWAVAWYRFGRWLAQVPQPALRRVVLMPWWFLFRFFEMFTGVSLPLGAQIGPGLRIWHFGGIFINEGSVIGANCTLRQGVTIGNRRADGGAPRIGDDVDVGAYAQILGDVEIGSGAKIGAMALVLKDVPSGCVAVGVPAKVVGAGEGVDR